MNLSDKIWITRKTRIFTEKRLLNYAHLSEIFVIIFSLFMVFFSIWNYLNSSQNISFLMICGAIALLAVSIFLSSQKFNERANAMRNCYIRLHDLYYKVMDCESSQKKELLDTCLTSYNDILINIENHTGYDYRCLRYSLRKDTDCTLPSYTRFDFAQFIAEKIIRILAVLILFLIPFLLSFTWNYLS